MKNVTRPEYLFILALAIVGAAAMFLFIASSWWAVAVGFTCGGLAGGIDCLLWRAMKGPAIER